MKAIILSYTVYKEKGAILNALTSDGVIVFNAPSLFSQKSKYGFLKECFTIADIIVEESKKTKHYSLKEASLIFTPFQVSNDFDKTALLLLLNELFIHMLKDEEMVSFYDELLIYIDKINKNQEIYLSSLILLSLICKESGYSFNADECIHCGSKNDIVNFSFYDGGFVCKKCYHNHKETLFKTDELLKLREIFKHKSLIEKTMNSIDRDLFIKIMKPFIVFISDSIGYKVKNFSLFL